MGDLSSSFKSTKTLVKAVIFDLDGTLLNTEQATKDILKVFLGRYGLVPDAVKERKRLGMTQKESVNSIIKDYDLPLTPDQFIQNIMPLYEGMWLKATALPGANRLLEHLYKYKVPFALASNALRKNIDVKISQQKGWKERFSVIIGSDEVKAGKPAPDMFLEAAKRMGVNPADCLVIEDSLVGVKAGKAAGMNVTAVPSIPIEIDAYSIADSVIHSLLEFQPELWGLPPFGDFYCVSGLCKALRIYPICFKGTNNSGILHEFSDDGSCFPDQLQGLYFGWAIIDVHNIIKVLIGIGWVKSSCSSRRKIQAWVVDESIVQIDEKEMQLMIVGYIRGPVYMGNMFDKVEIVEEDKLIATAALNSPEYSFETCKSLFPETCP
ncbi:hypothetical protein M9H77_21168 [Catharanthus roseus]|uniref:Uncharacterized protein n=1 Tax=Catharanthus roseus TaxID=4058 RepID=A0ACC0ANA8_CATRO|nr:hypothetical protein M9H77_21168 [Catharanthus roseus]